MHACACCVNKKVATLYPFTDPIYISVQLTLTFLIWARFYCFCLFFLLPTTGATFFMINNTTYLVHHTVLGFTLFYFCSAFRCLGRPPNAIASYSFLTVELQNFIYVTNSTFVACTTPTQAYCPGWRIHCIRWKKILNISFCLQPSQFSNEI